MTPRERELISHVLEDHQPSGDPCSCCGSYSCTCWSGRSSVPTTWDVYHLMEEIDKVITTE